MAERSVRAAKAIRGTAAFGKFLAVLQAIADAPQRPNLAELRKSTDLARPTLYRVLAGLKSEGLIVESPELRRFSLGPRLISLASQSWDTSDLRMIAREQLEKLHSATAETVHLAMPSGTEMIFMDKIESLQSVRMTSSIGVRVPMYTTSVGKAYLAFLGPSKTTGALNTLRLSRRTSKTITRRPELDAELKKVRSRGYALDLEENEPEICCIGAAICDRRGLAAGAISVSIPSYRFSKEMQTRFSRIVTACAAQISANWSSIGPVISDRSDR
jgi:DNA-binding IclR family transcriptional regulator